MGAALNLVLASHLHRTHNASYRGAYSAICYNRSQFSILPTFFAHLCIYFTRCCYLPRLTGEFSSPFRIFPFVEEMSPHRIELIVKVRADIPEQNYGANVRVVFPVPQTSGTVSTKLGSAAVGQSAEYIARDQKVIWNIKVRPFSSP